MLRLTRSGVLVLVGIPALVSLAWLFGQPELAVAAAATTALLVGSVVAVGRRPRLALRRTIRPPRVTVGDPCEVHLVLHNIGRSRSPVLRLRDDVGRFGSAVLHIAPLRRSGAQEVAYSLPTGRRGLHPVGPLSVEAEDPFGLLRRRVVVGEVSTAIVLPRTWTLRPLPPSPSDETEPGFRHLMAGTTVEEEFATIRPYEVGDDIRRIHWRTTARVGRPMVRQYDLPWQRRTTVLLDCRPDGEDPTAFERSVSVAASLVTMAAERGEVTRLVMTGLDAAGFDSGHVIGSDHLDELLDRLTAVRADPASSMSTALSVLGSDPVGSRRRSGGLVTVVTHIPEAEQVAWESHTRDFGLRTLVGTAAHAPVLPSDALVVHWDGDLPLSEVWDRAMGDLAGSLRSRSATAL